MSLTLAWIVPIDLIKSLKRSGISENFILPATQINSQQINICNSHIWLIGKGEDIRLTAFLTCRRLERYTEGYHEGDFLLHVDTNWSFRISKGIEINDSISALSIIKNLPIGINVISAEAHAELCSLTLSIVQTKILVPGQEMFKSISFDSKSRGKSLVKLAMSKINQCFNLDEIWGYGLGNRPNPLAFFTYCLLENKLGRTAKQLLTYIESHTALEAVKTLKHPSQIISSETYSPQVDLDFTKLEPQTIYAREFISSNLSIDIEGAMQKTEISEKQHQDMLRDICVFLNSQNIATYESTSIDLMVEKNGLRFFEIKSTNINNIYSQCAKGAFQLAYYANVIKEEYENFSFALVIHVIENSVVQSTCLNALSSMGINCLIYDPSIEWPERVKSLLNKND